MKSAAGGRLTSDIEHLVESLSLPRALSETTQGILNGLPGTGKSYLTSSLVERLSFILESDVLFKRLVFPPYYSAKEIEQFQIVPT